MTTKFMIPVRAISVSYVTINAESAQEAREKLLAHLHKKGVDLSFESEDGISVRTELLNAFPVLTYTPTLMGDQ